MVNMRQKRVLIFGGTGFIGGNLANALSHECDVTVSVRNRSKGKDIKNNVLVDLLAPETIEKALLSVRPDIVINAAGVIENTSKARQNVEFTTNILKSVLKSGLKLKKIVVFGSAAEYGLVDKLPVPETAPLNAVSPYAVSKKEEVKTALNFAKEHGLPVVVPRIFNPIGENMPKHQLIPNLIRQKRLIRAGKSDTVEISRLDSARDFVDIKDVVEAIRLLAHGGRDGEIYNVGSGIKTTIKDVIEILFADVKDSFSIVEQSGSKEPQVASQADISKIAKELKWKPEHSLEGTLRRIETYGA